MIGPWCFPDTFGPLTFADDTPMNAAPHPHIVTWLFDGEVLHDDSLGSAWVARPGGVNVMTPGGSNAHAEQTPRANRHATDERCFSSRAAAGCSSSAGRHF